jgi:hypothetical protein
MAASKWISLGPLVLTTTTNTNLFSPPTLTGGVNLPEGVNTYYLLRHIRVGNKTASAAKLALWKSTTADDTAGREIVFPGAQSAHALTQGIPVPANSYLDWYGILRLDSSETNKFITGGSDTATALIIWAEGEFGLV